MITLNSERGLQRIESWDDILSTPGFTTHVDPKTVKLKEIIGSYSFGMLIPCGLSTCQQPHANGFLVVAADGRVTNLGRICGQRHFSVEFTQMSRVFLAAVRAQNNREFLWEVKNRIPTITAEVSAIRGDQYGASWINVRINQLTGKSGSLPTPIVNAVRQAIRRGDGALMTQRKAEKDEREALAAATEVTGFDRRNRISDFVEVQVGQLDGFVAIAAGNGLKEIVGSIEQFVATLAEADIDALPDKQLRELAKIGGELKPNLARFRAVVAAGRRLLVRQNIQQLAQFLVKREDIRAFDLFLRDLPPKEG